MIYKISKENKKLKGTIDLPASKSISNRILIIQALAPPRPSPKGGRANAQETPGGSDFKIKNLAEAEDTQVLKQLLDSSDTELNAGSAGTTMRFLTAYLAAKEGTRVLTGSERMKERPISVLVNVLRQLGANIEYLGNEGYPPLKIQGTELTGSEVEIDGSVSSQYISALLLIAPTLPNGLIIKIKDQALSQPYINMTLEIMKHFGVKSKWRGNEIVVAPQKYIAQDFEIEADWSAASYWYEMAALSDDVDITLTGLKKKSLQGDSVVAEIFGQFGIMTTFLNEGIHLTKSEIRTPAKGGSTSGGKSQIIYDLSNCPDLAQTLAVTCTALNIPATLSGLNSLRIKETDRIVALKKELNKLGVKVEELNKGSMIITPISNIQYPISNIQTYKDHRMAMAFAPMAIKLGEVKIKDPGVVNKSYPNFWNDLKTVGFEIEEINE